MPRKLLSVSGWPLRRKVALVLTVPMLLAAVLAGLQVTDQLRRSADHAAAASQVTVLPSAIAYLDAAETAVVVARKKNALGNPKRDAAIEDVTTAATAFEAAAGGADLTAAQQEQVRAILDLSQQLRNSEAYVSASQSVSQVRQLHRGITQLVDQIVGEQAEPSALLPVVLPALDGRLSLAMQQFQVAYDGGSLANEADLAAEMGGEAAAVDRLGASLGTTQHLVMQLTSGNAQRFGKVRAGDLDLGGPSAYDPYDELTSDLLTEIDADLTAAASRARTLAIVSAALTGAALLVAVLLAVLVARTLLRPIDRVRTGAIRVAQEELPSAVARIRAGEQPGDITPIDVSTQEEMGQLARAFDDLHRQAITLASGEAELRSQVGDMFATLSRRNTSLINQQLGLIEDLERDEEDPRRLESLFRLDHLASRMRRTAESLMVLADAPTAGSEGVDLSVADLLQAAIAGVRDYQRVQILTTPAARVSGTAAPDVVHLLTELVDNALNYSPPSAPVLIEAVRTPSGVEVEVADAGLGIPAADLARINDDLASGGDVTAETARRMGLLVVSRVARRRGLTARLELNERGGVTARVLLPDTLLPDAAPAAVPTWTAPDPVPPTAAAAYDEEPAAAAAPTPLAPAAVPAPPPAASAEEQDTHRYLAAIDALTRLPQRQPGRAGTPAPAPAPAPVPEPTRAPDPTPVAAAPEPVVPEPVVPEPEPTPEPAPTGGPEETTPIFMALRSNWFSAGDRSRGWATGEVEAGWEAAQRVSDRLTEHDTEHDTEVPAAATASVGGLPVRRPGQRLVPGGVTAAAPPVVRDPEAIRARLAAHAAGVSRGRTDATQPIPDPVVPTLTQEADPA